MVASIVVLQLSAEESRVRATGRPGCGRRDDPSVLVATVGLG